VERVVGAVELPDCLPQHADVVHRPSFALHVAHLAVTGPGTLELGFRFGVLGPLEVGFAQVVVRDRQGWRVPQLGTEVERGGEVADSAVPVSQPAVAGTDVLQDHRLSVPVAGFPAYRQSLLLEGQPVHEVAVVEVGGCPADQERGLCVPVAKMASGVESDRRRGDQVGAMAPQTEERGELVGELPRDLVEIGGHGGRKRVHQVGPLALEPSKCLVAIV